MKITIYLKSGKKIKLCRVKKFNMTSQSDSSVESYHCTTKGSAIPFHICVNEIEAIVQHRFWFLDFLPW